MPTTASGRGFLGQMKRRASGLSPSYSAGVDQRLGLESVASGVATRRQGLGLMGQSIGQAVSMARANSMGGQLANTYGGSFRGGRFTPGPNVGGGLDMRKYGGAMDMAPRQHPDPAGFARDRGLSYRPGVGIGGSVIESGNMDSRDAAMAGILGRVGGNLPVGDPQLAANRQAYQQRRAEGFQANPLVFAAAQKRRQARQGRLAAREQAPDALGILAQRNPQVALQLARMRQEGNLGLEELKIRGREADARIKQGEVEGQRYSAQDRLAGQEAAANMITAAQAVRASNPALARQLETAATGMLGIQGGAPVDSPRLNPQQKNEAMEMAGGDWKSLVQELQNRGMSEQEALEEAARMNKPGGFSRMITGLSRMPGEMLRGTFVEDLFSMGLEKRNSFTDPKQAAAFKQRIQKSPQKRQGGGLGAYLPPALRFASGY